MCRTPLSECNTAANASVDIAHASSWGISVPEFLAMHPDLTASIALGCGNGNLHTDSDTHTQNYDSVPEEKFFFSPLPAILQPGLLLKAFTVSIKAYPY